MNSSGAKERNGSALMQRGVGKVKSRARLGGQVGGVADG